MDNKLGGSYSIWGLEVVFTQISSLFIKYTVAYIFGSH